MTLPAAPLDDLLAEAERAHGHLCAGQVLGVRMAILALRQLGVGDPRPRTLAGGELNPDRKRLVTYVEIDRCATDAIGVVTACRVGKRTLKLRDWGKMAATFADLATPVSAVPETFRAVRVVALETSKNLATQRYPALEKNAAQMRAYRELADSELFTVAEGSVFLPASELPGFKGERVLCARCGEGVNFNRFLDVQGQRLCLPCAGATSIHFNPTQ